MLAASKDKLIAETRQQAVSLRKLELDVIVDRFTDVISIAALTSGFTFTAIVEFELPEDDIDSIIDGNLDPATKSIIGTFYICSGTTLALGMYVVVLSTVIVNAGYRLALQGSEHHSLDRATAVLIRTFPTVIGAGAAGLASMLVAAFAMVWVKTRNRSMPLAWSSITILLALGIVVTGAYVVRMAWSLSIDLVIHADVQVEIPGVEGAIDLEEFSLNPHGEADGYGDGVSLYSGAGGGSGGGIGGGGISGGGGVSGGSLGSSEPVDSSPGGKPASSNHPHPHADHHVHFAGEEGRPSKEAMPHGFQLWKQNSLRALSGSSDSVADEAGAADAAGAADNHSNGSGRSAAHLAAAHPAAAHPAAAHPLSETDQRSCSSFPSSPPPPRSRQLTSTREAAVVPEPNWWQTLFGIGIQPERASVTNPVVIHREDSKKAAIARQTTRTRMKTVEHSHADVSG